MIKEKKYVKSKKSGIVYAVLDICGDVYCLTGFPIGPFTENTISLHKYDVEEINE